MTCKLRAELETAASALKEAVKKGLDVDDLSSCDMGEIYNAYNSVKRTLKNLPEHKEDQITFSVDPTPGFEINDLAYDASQPIDFGTNISLGNVAAEPVSFNLGGTDTVTVPEHEDDEKIVL